MFKEELSLVPHLPGCYLMKNKDNIVIYVGKSKNLKNRLSSYFQREHTGKTMMLVREIDHFEYIVTNTEMESLLLEINLIKKYNPKYNILYRDDKSYPYIELTSDKVPTLRIIRRINKWDLIRLQQKKAYSDFTIRICLVIQLELEPRTPTLKVLCSTS